MSTTRSTQKSRNRLERIPISLLVAVGVVALVFSSIGAFFLGTKGQEVQNTQAATQGQLDVAESKVQTGGELAGASLEICMDPAIVAVLKERGHDSICDLAVIVQTQAAEPVQGKTGKTGERGPGPTKEQIDRAVVDYCVVDNRCAGKMPTIDQLTTAIGNYLRVNPPEPGRPPTAEEIAIAAANYIASHADQFRGAKGEDAPPPTVDQLKAAVESYCAESGRCQGEQGPQGISITGTNLMRDEQGVCTLYLTWENPANGNTGQFTVQVNDEMCPAPPGQEQPPILPPTGGG